MIRYSFILLLFIIISLLNSCRSDKKQFDIFSSDQTKITFDPLAKKEHANDNEIKEFGNAVAIGDLNNDGLPDLVFSGIYANPEVYLNKGGLQFENITVAAGIAPANGYNAYGVAIIDINNDGWNDLYLCANGRDDGADTSKAFHNLLYINQRNGTFVERSTEYGLAISGNCYMPYFFDFDKDDDPDLFLLIFPNFTYNPFDITYMQNARNDASGAHSLLLENREGKFIDVTREKGIETMPATNNSCIISDINMDGWPDIYVANDFIFPDQFYINHHGHFNNEIKGHLSKTSMFSMGADCADINNDLYPDLVVADMLSEGHFRRKMNTLSLSTGFYDVLKENAFPQYQHNAIQLSNNGENFSEIAFIANAASTEWSWSPILADFDNDGWKDLFVPTGSRKELTNLDYLSNFNNESGGFNPLQQWMLDWTGIPSYSYNNYIFRNNHGFSFSDKTIAWGLEHSTNSEAAAYADLDGDGDVDIVVCNTNCPPYILRNNNNTLYPRKKYLRISLHGAHSFNYPTGTKIYLYSNNKVQLQEAINTKGYLSMSESMIHFGVDTVSMIDSIQIFWPSGKSQTIRKVHTNSLMQIFETNAIDSFALPIGICSKSIDQINNTIQPFVHREDNFNDFKRDKIIPHGVSKEGPAIAVADINKDGAEDYYVSGAKNQKGALYIQNSNGTFQSVSTAINQFPNNDDETAVVWADLDGNGYPDLISGTGSNAANGNDTMAHHLCIWYNQGNLKFERKYTFPLIKNPIGSISVSDIDGDGDLDIFVGSRLVAGSYGIAPESYLLENQGVYFADITDKVPGLRHIGMVTASAFADLDGDKSKELIISGEFMPLSVFKKTTTGWQNRTDSSGLSLTNGLWSCLSITDMNNDGYPDILAGNWGGQFYLASDQEGTPIALGK